MHASAPAYAMCGGHAGQAVVQTVRHELSSTDYVLKAFATTAAFNAEAALYTDGDRPLGAFLPQMHEILDNAGRGFRDPHGHAMPPCIVMEKGEALDVWCSRRKPDLGQAYVVRISEHKHCASQHCLLHFLLSSIALVLNAVVAERLMVACHQKRM